jgi:hypothetical protein
MRQLFLWALALSLAAYASATPPSTDNVYRPVQKPMGPEYQNPPGRVTGDTVADPFSVGTLPFTATGNTCDFANDYDYACPYTDSTAPDVVYELVPTADMAITVDLCASTYDTKVYVYDSGMNILACNDDYCDVQSLVRNVPVTTGHTYYIVIDGYGGSCGNYNMVITEHIPCELTCSPGAMIEGEPVCYDGYYDTYNSGCNATPFPAFQSFHVGPWLDITICGTTGVFPFDTVMYRDTDWFELDCCTFISVSGDAEVPCYFSIIDGRGGCDEPPIVAYAVAGPCAPVSDMWYVPDDGPWWVCVCPSVWDYSLACGSLYNLRIQAQGCGSPAESTTWGRVKGLFR